MRAVAVVLALFVTSNLAFADPAEQQRQEIQKMEKDTLAKLYFVQPSAKRAIEGAAGYAVFSNFGMKILVAGGGSGNGVALDRKSGQGAAMQGAMSVSPGVWMYQLTDQGLAAEGTVKGTKYWKDADLN